MKLRAVVFDLFDTLVDLHMERLPLVELGGRKIPSTVGALHQVIVQWQDVEIEPFVSSLREVDKIGRETRYKQGREYPTLLRFQELCKRLGVDDPEAAETLTETHMAAIQAQVRYLPHHVELLSGLRERGLRTAVCSNFSHTPTGLRVLEESGLTPHLDVIVISEQIGIRKPRPEIFSATLQQLEVPAEATLHVGDNLDADVHGAAGLGLRTAWVTRRVDDPGKRLEAHSGAQPQHVVQDLAEISELIDA